MDIKIHCPCGAKFAFEVEPADGRMPVCVACPACGQDATTLANLQIQAQLGDAPRGQESVHPPPKPRLRVASHAPESAPAAPGSSAPPSADRAQGTPTGPSQSSPRHACPKHPGQPAVEHCRVCGKPICRQCMRLFGYVCSAYCSNKAEAEGMQLPVYKGQRAVQQKKARTRSRALVAAVSVVILLLIGAGIYYKAYASRPHVVLTLPQDAEGVSGGFCKLLGADGCLRVSEGQIALHDLESGEARWSARFDDPASDAEDAIDFGPQATLLDDRDALWIRVGNRILCYDRGTGERLHAHTFDGFIEECTAGDAYITLIGTGGDDYASRSRVGTRIALADGSLVTEPLPSESGRKDVSTSFIPAGPNVARVDVELLEQRQVARETIKAPERSIVDSGRVSGANAMQAAEELLNEIARTGGEGVEYEDASRYQVTIQRCLDDRASEWSAEVVGHVEFYPLQTVDLLVAGTTLQVLDKQNIPQWKATLTYPVAEDFHSGFAFAGRLAPALQTPTTLFFFDRGMLTAFDLSSGTARWRVPSVGIRQVQPDGRGHLYVSTTSANAEDIQYSQQIKVLDAVQPVLMKVDAATGEVLWTSITAGQNCFVSGEYVYATKSTIDLTLALNPEQEGTHFRVIRIHPEKGTRLWTYYQPREPLAVDFQANRILLHFPDQVQLLSYLSL